LGGDDADQFALGIDHGGEAEASAEEPLDDLRGGLYLKNAIKGKSGFLVLHPDKLFRYCRRMFPRLPVLVVFVVLSVVSASADTFLVTNANDSGTGSLREAITDANAHPNSAAVDVIGFDLPGTGVHTIVLASALPDLIEGVTINGWSQPGFQNAPLIELTAAPGWGSTDFE